MRRHDNTEVKDALLKTDNQRNVFVESFAKKIEELQSTQSVSDARCNKGHPFQPFIRRIAIAANEANSLIHAGKKRKVGTVKSSNNRKLIKLTSGTSTAEIIDLSQNCI